MKYPKECRLERMSAGNPDFEWMNKPILDVKLEKVVAATSWGMAVVPAQVSKDETSGFVPIEAIKDARAACKQGDEHLHIACKDHAVVGATIRRRADSEEPIYPNWQKAMTIKSSRPQQTVRVVINTDYLKRIADAMGTTCLEMTMQVEMAGAESGMVKDRIDLKPHHSQVYPATCLEAMGAIMPMRPL